MKKSMVNLEHSSKKEYLPLYVLLLISMLLHFPFVLKGFGENDAVNLAVSIIDFITHGEKGVLTTLYFMDVVPFYVIYIKFIMKLLDYDYSYLALVVNYTNAVVGTLIIIPAYLLVKRLFDNISIAFCTLLTFIFVPSVYQSSIYGFPHFIAIFFFITSLYFFLIWLDDERYIWLILSFITLTSAILFKSDIILGSGAYLGLLYIRKVKIKVKIISAILLIILSIISFLFIRQWVIGINTGYTASLSNFLEWFKYFFNLLFSKGVVQIIKEQVSPIAYGIGFLNFFMASIALVFYLIKRKKDILVFVLSWTALPTGLWLFIQGNSARHNMLSVLPFIMIIFLFIHEKVPRFIAIFPIILILGNYLITPPAASTLFPSGNLYESQVLLNSRVNQAHLTARKIAGLEEAKMIFTRGSFRAFIYYEIFSFMPEYKLIKINDFCYMIKNKECIICSLDGLTRNIDDMISNYHLEEYRDYTIILPGDLVLYSDVLKEKGYKIYRYEQ